MSISTITTNKMQFVNLAIGALISDECIEICIKIQLQLILVLFTITEKSLENRINSLSYNEVNTYKF